MQNALYFIAIIPPIEIAKEVEAFKTYAAEHFNTSRVLRLPAHITIIPPFKWPSLKPNELKFVLKKIADKADTFYLNMLLNHFDYFSP